MLLMTAGRAETGSSAARDLTVRLFSTAAIAKITIESKNAQMRMCESACKPIPTAASVVITVVPGDGEKLRVGSRSGREVLVDGQLRAVTEDGRSASGAGKWAIRRADDGLHVTLTLPSERYVMAVLQSEAGPDDGPEALKALAVVARSFALTHPDRHGAEGLCDSTHCQAARMAPVPARIRDAVLATAGETLWIGGRRVDGYFTQNCGGHTADAAEIWGGESKAWLGAHADPYCQRQPSQWHARVDREELLRALRDQSFRVPEKFVTLRIVATDSSGRAARLDLGDGAQRLLLRAAELRFALNRELGWNTIRSDWYSVHADGRAFVFDGRGYGHGVGLCQAGAAEMAREGKRYREILAFYFAGAKVRVNASDDGWRTESEAGWTLRFTTLDAEIVRAGNAAWVDARNRWRTTGSVRPTVTLAPTTELFRQITNEPGWAAAATSGDGVVLQPAAIATGHGGYEPLLLHEFLHVLVEGEATGSTPLWFREGLVEALEGARSSGTSMTSAQLETALQHAPNLREAQNAHHAAGALVNKIIARYGLGSVRGWLSSGVPAGVLSSQ